MLVYLYDTGTPATGTVRAFLPRDCQKDNEINVLLFHDALAAWYAQDDSPLLSSEYDALVRKFRNNITGYVNIAQVDKYIAMHVKPCRKHGRKVCADCYFLKDCCKCLCQRYTAESYADPTAACLRCAHPPSHHRRCPLQIRQLKDEESLLGLLSIQHEPDFSLTTPGTINIFILFELIHRVNYCPD